MKIFVVLHASLMSFSIPPRICVNPEALKASGQTFWENNLWWQKHSSRPLAAEPSSSGARIRSSQFDWWWVCHHSLYILFDHSGCQLPTKSKETRMSRVHLSVLVSSQVHPSADQLLLRIRLLNLFARAESPSSCSVSFVPNRCSLRTGVPFFLCSGQILQLESCWNGQNFCVWQRCEICLKETQENHTF